MVAVPTPIGSPAFLFSSRRYTLSLNSPRRESSGLALGFPLCFPYPFHAGPKGGFHVFVGVETTGLVRAGKLSWTLHSSSGVELASRTLDVSTLLLEDVACGWARRRDVLVFIRTEEVDQYRGVPAQLGLTLDVAGADARTWSARVVPR